MRVITPGSSVPYPWASAAKVGAMLFRNTGTGTLKSLAYCSISSLSFIITVRSAVFTRGSAYSLANISGPRYSATRELPAEGPRTFWNVFRSTPEARASVIASANMASWPQIIMLISNFNFELSPKAPT